MSPLLETSAGAVAYDVLGAPANGGLPPLVLLPSGAHDRRDYDELRARLPGACTIALDWPAHGESPAGTAASSAMAFADIAEQFVEALAPAGAIVAGNSVGGFAAARMAVRRPELVRGLAVIDGGGFAARTPLVHAFCALMSRPRLLRAVYPAFSALYMRSRTPADRRARAAAIATTRGGPGLATVAGLWRSFASPGHDLRARAGEISCPTLLLWGRRDPVIPVRVARRAARLIPRARLVVLDTGHVPHTSDPDGVAQALGGLLAELRCDPPAGPSTAAPPASGDAPAAAPGLQPALLGPRSGGAQRRSAQPVVPCANSTRSSSSR